MSAAFHKVIVFGDELSNKTALLNTIAGKDIFDEILYNENEQADFKSQIVTINNTNIEFFDTISFNTCSKNNKRLKKKLASFLETISFGVKVIIIAIPISKSPISLESIDNILDSFDFTNMENIYFVLTQGDLLLEKEDRDIKYETIEEDIRNLIKKKGITIERINVFYYDEDNQKNMREAIISVAQEKNNECIVRSKFNVDDLMEMFMKKNEADDIPENKDSLWTCFARTVNSNLLLLTLNPLI